MAFGNFINSLKGIFTEGPLKDLTEEMSQSQNEKQSQLQPGKLSAEQVVITDAFRKTFNVNSPVRENMHNSFMFSMLVMASHIVIADGKVEPEEYQFLGQFLRDNFGEETETEGMEVMRKLIAKREELEARKPMAFIQIIGDCGSQISRTLSEDLRYQMLSMLARIVKSDKNITDTEIEALRDVAVYIGMKTDDADALMKE